MTTATFRLKRFLLKTMEIDKSLIHLKIHNKPFYNAIDKMFKQIHGRHLKWFKKNNSTEKITWNFSTWIFIRIFNYIWICVFCFYLFFTKDVKNFEERGRGCWLNSFLIKLFNNFVDSFNIADDRQVSIL